MDVSFVATLIGGLQAIPRFRYEHKTQGNCLPVFVSLRLIRIFHIILSHHIITISVSVKYRGADKSLARPTSQCILFDGENISFDASLVLYIYIYIVPIFLQL
jgi:hypothetical protein